MFGLVEGVPEWLLPSPSTPEDQGGAAVGHPRAVHGWPHASTNRNRMQGGRDFSKLRIIVRHLSRCVAVGLFLPSLAWGQLLVSANGVSANGDLPDAPLPQPSTQEPSSSSNVSPPRPVSQERPKAGSTLPPCPAAVPLRASAVANAGTAPEKPATPEARSSVAVSSSGAASVKGMGNSMLTVPPAPCEPASKNPFQRFLSTSAPDPLTVKQKLVQAGRDVIDPFNLITIGGLSAIYVAQNARSDYGPGMLGFAKNAGVSLTQGMTGEFFGTFLLPAIMHQDPRYHRMPHAKLMVRVGHVIVQTLVTQGDNGRPMFNYSNFPGFLIEDEISNLYVPMRHTNLESTAARVTIGLATVPIGNAITEFLPDVARHINFNVVFLQRIVNQVSGRDGTMNNE